MDRVTENRMCLFESHIGDDEYELMPEWFKDNLPPLFTNPDAADNPLVWGKFFDPEGSQVWYVVEYDGDQTFFGYVTEDGNIHNGAYRYFTLEEITRFNEGYQDNVLPVERDNWFNPTHIHNLEREDSGLA